MNNEIKMNLNIRLPGRVMMSEQLCSKNNIYDEQSLFILDKRNKRHFYNIKTRKTIDATQSINITKTAYDYFIGKDNPHFVPFRQWSKMSKKEKLKAHLDNICEALGGLSYEYKIFED